MANQLGMAEQQAIIALARNGWSRRRIARELGVHRETVGRYLKLWQDGQTRPHPPPDAEAKPAIPITGSAGQRSRCEPYRAVILDYLDQGLSAQRIWQDLQADHGFVDGYQSVQRFVRKLRTARPLPFRRMECGPGEEVQVDFGTGAPIRQPDGRRRRPHLFRIVLSHSRKAYREVVYRQTTESFIRCLENAFCHFGGVAKTVVVDNLKAAVIKADWFDPELNPKIQAFADHYGTVILPTKPRTPRHKGKIERQVGYAQDNARKGRSSTSLQGQNAHLLEWERHVADTRIHGTTRRQVGKVFQELERPALQPLPPGRFPSFNEAQRKVSRDAHVEVDKAYYVDWSRFRRSIWVGRCGCGGIAAWSGSSISACSRSRFTPGASPDGSGPARSTSRPRLRATKAGARRVAWSGAQPGCWARSD